MISRAIAILAIFLTLLSVTEAAGVTAPTTAAHEFNYACAYAATFYDVQCGDLKPPLVITSRVVPGTYRGFYIPGEPYIFINKRLWLHDQPQWHKTVVHETLHYILREKADTRFSRCESEEAARRVGDSFTATPYNDNWRSQYRC